jgi:hypothetical protein
MRAPGRSVAVVGVVMAAFLGGAVCHLLFDGSAARAAGGARTVRAEEFVLVDADGRELARLGVSAKGLPALTLLDEKGRARLRASNRTPRGRDGADLVAGQEARATRIGDQAYSAVAATAAAKAGCAKPERRRHATRDARPCGLRLGPSSAASRLLAVPDPSTSLSPLLAATRPEAQRGSRGVLLEALSVGALEEPAGYGMDTRDADGHNRATFAYWADDISGMRIHDAEGVKRIGLGLADYGCGLALYNESGTEVVGVGAGPQGGGDFVLKHPFDGHEVWRASRTPQNPPEGEAAGPP